VSDDIVTRLREQVAKHFCYYEGDKCADCRNANEAAFQIEELRKDLNLQARCVGRHYDQFADLRNEIERLREWKELAYLMRNRAWWVLGRRYLTQFDELHRADWDVARNG
jgi:hypothetical protein